MDALIFAELSDGRTEWQKALEGWNVRESQQVLEWQAEARAEATVATQRANLLRLLEKRWKLPVPSDLATVIQATQDLDVLLRWFDAAAEANSFEEFRAAMLTIR